MVLILILDLGRDIATLPVVVSFGHSDLMILDSPVS